MSQVLRELKSRALVSDKGQLVEVFRYLLQMKSDHGRIIKELDFLIGSQFFDPKIRQKELLQHYRRAYKQQRKIVPVSVSELSQSLYKDDVTGGDKVSVQLNALQKNLEAIDKTEEGKGRPGIRLHRAKKGTYELVLLESVNKSAADHDADGASQPSELACDSEILLENEKSCGTSHQSVDEIVLWAKELDIKGATRIKWMAVGVLWSSILVGVPVLIFLLIGLPYWLDKPLQGLSLTGMLLVCTCIAILAKPLSRLPGVSFGRWWGEIFFVYRQGVLMLARHSGACVVAGCGGSLSVEVDRAAPASLLNIPALRWIIVCKNVPMEHPRTPFDFTELDTSRPQNSSFRSESARTA